jgi:hypothetical protein
MGLFSSDAKACFKTDLIRSASDDLTTEGSR